MSIEQTIENLVGILQDPNCFRMNTSNIKGYLGELYVKQRMEKEGLLVEHVGNQSGYDLESDGLKIDVKCSTLKIERKIKNWGWALKQTSKKQITCTHFVCVGLSETLAPVNYYIISSEHLSLFPPAGGRFNKVLHRFNVPFDENDTSTLNEFQECQRLINRGIAVKVRGSEKLIQVLKGMPSKK